MFDWFMLSVIYVIMKNENMVKSMIIMMMIMMVIMMTIVIIIIIIIIIIMIIRQVDSEIDFYFYLLRGIQNPAKNRQLFPAEALS